MTARSFLNIDSFSPEDIAFVLRRAEEFAKGSAPSERGPTVVGLLFLEPSLRTRTGFATAAARLGWAHVEVNELRVSQPAFRESVDDTLRILAGYCDVVVTRPGCAMAGCVAAIGSPLINGGDAGPIAEHPTQALIDLFAIEQLKGPVGTLRVGVVGDLAMRAARSLLRLLDRIPPAELLLVGTPDGVAGGRPFTTVLAEATDVDVLYVAGVPDSLPPEARGGLIIDEAFVEQMDESALILSPMPLLDEVSPSARQNRRVRVFDQSDLGQFARMAMLELAVLSPRDSPAIPLA